jgi:hypothetical protein
VHVGEHEAHVCFMYAQLAYMKTHICFMFPDMHSVSLKLMARLESRKIWHVPDFAATYYRA